MPISPWTVVALLWVAYVTNYVDRQVVFSIFPALRRDLGFTDVQLGLVGTVFTWVYSLCMPVTGRLADVWRRDRVIVVSLVLWSLATVGTAASGSVGEFLLWRAVMGVTESLYVPAALGLIAALHAGPTRSRALAVHAMAQLAGIVLGGWYGGWSADHIGWRVGFYALGAAGIGYAGVLWHAFRRLPDLRRHEKRAASVPLEVFRSYSYLALSAAFFAFCIMLWMLYAWLPNFIYERFGLSMTESGLTATLYLQTSSAVGVLTGGFLGDRFGRQMPAGRFLVAGAGMVLCAPFAYLTLALDSLLGLKLAAVGFGLFAGLFIANLFASAYDVIAERNYGFGAGALNMIGGLAGGAAILAAGLGKTSVGMPTLMGWAAAASAALACLMMAVARLRFRADRALHAGAAG